MARRRPAEFHYVEWDFRRWLSSLTRGRCHALGGLLGQAAKGVYRDLLDHCYNDGSIPVDFESIAALCGCTTVEIEQVWPVIQGKFHPHRKDKSLLVNSEAQTRRREFERKRKSSKRGGVTSAENRVQLKSSSSMDIVNTTCRDEQHHLNQKRSEAKRSTEKKSGGSNGTNSPPPLDPDRADSVRGMLVEYVGDPNWGEPDEQIVTEILDVLGSRPIELLKSTLLALHARKRQPGRSWKWFVTVLAGELGGDHGRG